MKSDSLNYLFKEVYGGVFSIQECKRSFFINKYASMFFYRELSNLGLCRVKFLK
jgi:hypothetical protein